MAIERSRRMSAATTPASALLSASQSGSTLRHPRSFTSMLSDASPVASLPPLPLIDTTANRPNLTAQHEEVQSLRRDLAVMRQLHVDFLADTKESFSTLRAQNNSMRDVVRTKMGGSRAILDNSKAKLEAQCQDTIQSVEEISDNIDTAREDAYRRFVTPSKAQIAKISAELAKANEMVDQLSRDVSLADPTWRATWASELNRVMEEQKLLSYQSKLSADLINDIKDATEMWSNVQVFIDQRASGVGRGMSGKFRPPSPEAGTTGINHLLMEIRTKEGDPSSRLKAIEAQQKAREKELANRKDEDEFSNELEGFVKGRRLKKTGGTEEAERQRTRRQEMTLRRMLTGGAAEESGMSTPPITGSGSMTPQITGNQ